MKLGVEHLGEKLVYYGFWGKRPGYFILEGFEKNGGELFIYGTCMEGMEKGSRPACPKHADKAYYIITGCENNFRLYEETKDAVIALMEGLDFGCSTQSVTVLLRRLEEKMNKAYEPREKF